MFLLYCYCLYTNWYPIAVLYTEAPQWLCDYMDTHLTDLKLKRTLHNVNLTRDTLSRLQENRWLNDDIIYVFVELLIQFYHSAQPSRKIFHVSSLYCSILEETLKGESSAIEALKRMSKVCQVDFI